MTDNLQSYSVPSEKVVYQNSTQAITEADILITPALADRPARQPNLAAENQALHTLALKLMDDPQSMLKTLVEIARDLCSCDTAGVSLLETSDNGTSVFRWVAIAGVLESLEQKTAPANFSRYSACGEPQLYTRPERYFTYLHHPEFPIFEGLLFPVCVNNQPLGTFWILSHNQQRHFDLEDKRLMTSLAGFTGAALQSIHLGKKAQLALQSEQALDESQTRIQSILANMPGMVYRYIPSANGLQRFTFISSGCHDLFEVEAETALQDSNSIWNLIHPDDISSFQTSVNTAVEKFLPWEWNGRIITPSGKLKWIHGHSNTMHTNDGEAWDGFLIDITDRKQAEIALLQSESRLRLMIESAKDYAIFTVEVDGTIASWNSGAERLLGYSETEAIGKNCSMIFTPEDKEQKRPEQERQTALTKGRAEDERWHIRKNGSRFWGSGLVMPLQDEAGEVQGFVKILQDKTAQRRANERFQLLYDTTSDLLATEQPLSLMDNLFSKLSVHLELQSYYNFMVETKDNRLMLHLRNHQGISEETAKTLNWVEFGEYLCGLVAQRRQQIVLDREQIATHPNARIIGSMGITAYAGQPLIVHGRLLGTLCFASCTRTRFTPEEIDLLQSTCDQIAIAIDRANLIASIQQQAEQLQQANRIKDEFLAVLSHELRSPLNPILGWSRLLQNGKLDQAKTVQALATIERNAKLQSNLIEDLLDVSRILRGKLSLNITPVNLSPIIRSAIETVRLAAEAKSIRVEADLNHTVGSVLGDSTRLQQVVWNLLSNAVKFTPTHGWVEVKLAPEVENYAQIIVRDNGKGISSEFLPYVFDYFRQADSATTRKFGGLGLGLAIVRHLVELHGGTVAVDSPGEGLGATFTVRLPLMPIDSAENQTEQFSESSPNLQGVQVLVVDDDTDTRDYVVFLLEQAEARVISVTSASEAFAALSQSPPDILLSDIGMPDMDGYMLIRQIRALPPERGGQIPAIALTAYAGEIDYRQAMAAGFQQHIPKPVEPNTLVEAIACLIGKSK